MSLKTRLAVLEAAHNERELDRCARYLAECYRQPYTEVRQEIEAIVARRQAEGSPSLSPAEQLELEEMRREMQQWENSRG